MGSAASRVEALNALNGFGTLQAEMCGWLAGWAGCSWLMAEPLSTLARLGGWDARGGTLARDAQPSERASTWTPECAGVTRLGAGVEGPEASDA